MVYNLKDVKNATFYYGTGRMYLQKATGHQVAIFKARNESKNGDSVNVYIEADKIPLQMIRAFKNGNLEYTAEKITKSL